MRVSDAPPPSPGPYGPNWTQKPPTARERISHAYEFLLSVADHHEERRREIVNYLNSDFSIGISAEDRRNQECKRTLHQSFARDAKFRAESLKVILDPTIIIPDAGTPEA